MINEFRGRDRPLDIGVSTPKEIRGGAEANRLDGVLQAFEVEIADDADDPASRANDTHHGEEGHADHGLHSPDHRTGHDDDDLRVHAVRSGDLLLGP